MELYIDLGVALKLDLMILNLKWSRSGQTGASKAPVLYLNRKSSIPKLEGG